MAFGRLVPLSGLWRADQVHSLHWYQLSDAALRVISGTMLCLIIMLVVCQLVPNMYNTLHFVCNVVRCIIARVCKCVFYTMCSTPEFNYANRSIAKQLAPACGVC
jgi:hypothetical protein